ncbi:uncharacterized protein METZ01_LOCUS359723 [marine metagenome]|uniref:Uncharacterized protein n=1 Tax=marine metagenome TaxID=408172 RepID=A0A382SAG3_9ZZZZ
MLPKFLDLIRCPVPAGYGCGCSYDRSFRVVVLVHFAN